MRIEKIRKIAKILRVAVYVFIAITGILVVWSLVEWLLEDSSYEAKYTFASAILSFLLWLLTLITENLIKEPEISKTQLFPQTCGEQSIDLSHRRLYLSSAFGNYFASLLEREHSYVNLDGQIDLPSEFKEKGLEGLQGIYWALQNPKGPSIFVIAAEGGMGKSTLAARLVRCLYQQEAIDSILGDSAKTRRIDPVSGQMVDVEPGYYDANSFLMRLASQTSLYPSHTSDINARKVLRDVKNILLGRRTVIVLDNLESVQSDTELLQIVSKLTSRDLRIIVTTRKIGGKVYERPDILAISLTPIQSIKIARTFIQWHIETYAPTHPALESLKPYLNNERRIGHLLQKTGGLPLLMQLTLSDIATFGWDYITRLPDLYSSDLLEFLYAQRWFSLCNSGEMGKYAISILRFVADCQNEGKKVSHRRIINWSETAGYKNIPEDAIRMLTERFLLINQDLKKGDYVIFPSLLGFLQKQSDG